MKLVLYWRVPSSTLIVKGPFGKSRRGENFVLTYDSPPRGTLDGLILGMPKKKKEIWGLD